MFQMRVLATAAYRLFRVVSTPLTTVTEQLRYTASKTPEVTWNPELYSKNAELVLKGGLPLIDILNPRPGERILDVGCGSGELTKVIEHRGCEVVGIDGSLPMVKAAKEKGLDARHIDSCDMDFKEEFDAVFSRMCLHWVLKQETAVHNIRRSLKNGGRFVAEFTGERHMYSIVEPIERVFLRHGLPYGERFPWYLATNDEYKELLESQGFTVETISLLPRPIPIAMGARGWMDLFCTSFFVGMSNSEKLKLYEEIEQELDPKRITGDGAFIGDYVYLSFVAKKSATTNDSKHTKAKI